MSTNNITSIIDGYVTYNDQYWATGDNEKTLSATNLGISKTQGAENVYYGHWQCQGFAHFFASVIYGCSPLNDIEGKWVKYSEGLSTIELQPGDIIKTIYYMDDDKDGVMERNDHAAVVWKIDNNKVNVAEVWGSYGNLVKFGEHNGGRGDMVEISNLLPKLEYVYRYNGEAITPTPEPEPEPEVETVTVSFYDDLEKNGGKLIGTRTYTVGSAYGSFPTPDARTGYTFDKWYTATGGYVETWSPATSGRTKLYAHWNGNKYTIKLYPNYDNKSPVEKNVIFGQKFGDALAPISRERYTFNGWRTGKSDPKSDEFTSEMTVFLAYGHNLYAHWLPETYSISLYPGYGTNVQIDGVYKATTESSYGDALPTLTRCGYTHTGWKGSDGKIYNSKSIVTNKITKFTAIWEVKEVKVTYNYGYEENGVQKKTTGTVNYGDTYADAEGTNVPNMDNMVHPTGGYTFAGWHHDEVDGSDKVVMDEAHTLTAEWEPKTFKVSFDPEVDVINYDELDTIDVTYGQTYDEIPIPVSSKYYQFLGWDIWDDAGELIGENITSDSIVTYAADHTLSANWVKSKFIFLNYDDGNGYKTMREEYYGKTYSFLDVPEKDGYDFVGWFFDAGRQADTTYHGVQCNKDDIIKPEHPNYIYAAFKKREEVAVTYDLRGGTSNTVPEVNIKDEPYILPKTKKSGCSFLGWFYDEDCTSQCCEGDIVSNTEPHTLYADWGDRPVIITFDSGEGANICESKVVYVGRPYGDLPIPVHENHYEFGDWEIYDENGDVIDAIYPDSIVTVEENHTAIAYWNKTRMLSLDPDGGTISGSKVVYIRFGQPYPTLPTPIKEGYEFVGWVFNNTNEYGGLPCDGSVIAISEHPESVVATYVPIEDTETTTES